MVDLEELKKAGYSPKKLKAKFEKLPPGGAPAGVKGDERLLSNLVLTHQHRIDDGIKRCLSYSRITRAIDYAYDIAKNQTTYSLVRGLIDSTKGKSDIENIVTADELAQSLGLHSLYVPMVNASGDQVTSDGTPVKGTNMKPGYKLNLPSFVKIHLPMVMTLVRVRQASLYADIDNDPFLKYETVVSGPKERALAKVVTRRADRMASDTALRQTRRQSILQALMYGICINFPMESWWKNKQKVSGEEVVLQEGVRYVTPHASRIFWDQNHPQYTLNTETGCEYAGYWTLVRYGEVFDNKNYWNREKIGFGKNSWRESTAYSNFSSFYPCALAFPTARQSTGTGDNNRENNAFIYSKSMEDAAVDLTVIFHRLVPKDWGLYDYEYPVWHRFVYAGDTVIHCEPWAYHPFVADLYDSNAQSDYPISLALEAIPHQDHIGNLVTQALLTVKKNLIRMVAVNKDAIDQGTVEKIENNSENSLRGIEFYPYSGQELAAQNIRPTDIFTNITFPQMSVAEQITMLSTYISLIERILGFSPHEMGATTSHQISASEAQINAAGTLSRRSLTKAFVADTQHALKKSLYDAFMAYGDDDILVEVANLEEGQIELLKDAGLDVEKVDGKDGAALVKGTKSLLKLGSFFSSKADDRRTNDPQVAQLMLTMLDRVAANPELAALIGKDKIIQIYNAAVEMLGLPEDSRLTAGKGPLQQNDERILQVVQQLIGQQLEQLGQKVLQPLAQQVNEVGQATQQIAGQVGQLGQATQAVAQQGQQTQEGVQQLAQVTAQQGQKIQTTEQAVSAIADKLVQIATAMAQR